MKKVWLLFISCFLVLATKAQNNKCSFMVKGNIIDEHNKEKLSFVKIYDKITQRGYESDALGAFEIKNLCLGKHSFRFEHIDCEPLEIEIDITGDTVINVFMEHHQHLLKAVEINEYHTEVSVTQNSERLTQWQLIETRGLTLGESLKKINGVTSLNTGSSIAKPMIHGLHSNRILILNNGVRLESQQWGNEHAPEIDPFLAGEMVVVKGAMGVRYGSDAIGGVILIDPKPLPDTGFLNGELNTVFQTNGLQTANSLMLDGKINKLGGLQYRLQGTFKKGGNIHSPNYILANTGVDEKNFSYQLRYVFKNVKSELFYSQFNTTIGIYKGSHIGNITDLQNTLAGYNPPVNVPFTYQIGRPYQLISHEFVKAKLTYLLGHAGDLQLTYGRQFNSRSEYDVVFKSKQSESPELNFNITTHTAELLYNHHADWGLVGQAGIFAMHQANTYDGRFFIPNFINKNVSGFLIEKYVKSTFTLEAGIRYDYKTTDSYFYENKVLQKPHLVFSNVSFNLSGNFQFAPNQQLTAALASAWRAPGVNELYSNGVHHGAASFEKGNPNLSIEKVYTGTFGYRKISRIFQLVNEIYINYFQNYIYLKPSLVPVLTIRGAFPSFNYEQCMALFAGNDLSARINFDPRFSATVKSAVIFAENLTEDKPLPLIPSNRLISSLNYNQEFFRFKPVFSLEHVWVMEQKRYVLGSDYAPPPPSYHLFNLNIGSEKLFGNKNLSLLFSAQNLFNTSYRDYTNRFRYFIDEPGRNFILRLTIKF